MKTGCNIKSTQDTTLFTFSINEWFLLSNGQYVSYTYIHDTTMHVVGNI
jgi:hypothetical protein